MKWMMDHSTLIGGWAMFALSEALPFLPGKANSVAQFILSMLAQMMGAKKLPAPPPADGAGK